MNTSWADIQQLFERAWTYDQNGDAYNAVKLYKKVVKLAPAWSVPYHFLGLLYRQRNEWKPSLHYSQKATETNPNDRTAWQSIAIAATALKRWRIARKAWNQLGFDFRETNQALNLNLGVIPVCINAKTKPEIIWATQIDPARAIIQSVPQPASGRRWGEMILLDTKPMGHRVLNGRKLPIFEELELIHLSHFETYIVTLETSAKKDVDILDKLCLDAHIGFDNWSRATRQFWHRNTMLFPEFYDQNTLPKRLQEQECFLVALAAKSESEVMDLLNNWEIITLQNYTDIWKVDYFN